MAFSTQSAVELHSPFAKLDERIFVLPKGKPLSFENSPAKIIFFLGGNAEIEIGKYRGRRKLLPHDVLLVPHGSDYRYFNPDEHSASSLQVVLILVDSAIDDWISLLLKNFIHLKNAVDGEIAARLSLIRMENEQRRIGYSIRVQSIALELTVLLARKLHPGSGLRPARKVTLEKRIISAAKEFIFKHLDTDFTLGEVARSVGKGQEHLARVFKKETGQSVFDYVRDMRVAMAKTYLQDPKMNLSEISRKCGFQSLSFFSRTFKQRAGLSPSEYRSSLRPGSP